MARLVNVTASELLGKDAFYRIAFEPGWAAYGNNADFVDPGMRVTFEALAGTGIVFPVSRNSALPGSDVAVIDVKTTNAGALRSVSELVAALDDLSRHTAVASVQRITREAAVGSGMNDPAPDRSRQTTARTVEEQQDADKQDGFLDDVEDILKWIVILAAIVAGLYLVWQFAPALGLARAAAGRRS